MKKETIKKYMKKSISELPFSLCKLQTNLRKKVLLGLRSKDVRHQMYKLNLVRRIFLKKLIEWEKTSDSSEKEPEYTYSEALAIEKKLKQKQEAKK